MTTWGQANSSTKEVNKAEEQTYCSTWLKKSAPLTRKLRTFALSNSKKSKYCSGG
jgi:hypothetical protein